MIKHELNLNGSNQRRLACLLLLGGLVFAFASGCTMKTATRSPGPGNQQPPKGTDFSLPAVLFAASKADVKTPRQDWGAPVLMKDRSIFVSIDINAAAARDVVSEIKYLDGQDSHKRIHLYLNTSGGETESSFSIIDAMNQIQAPVDVCAIGRCESAGATILAGATGKRYATPNAVMMVHGSLTVHNGMVYDMPDPFSKRYEAHWRRHASLPNKWFPLKGSEMHYLTPEQALQYHVIDAIQTGPLESDGALTLRHQPL